MTFTDWIGLATIALAVCGSTAALFLQLGSLKQAIWTIEKQIAELFAVLNTRPCSMHIERIVKNETRLNGVDSRLTDIERAARRKVP